MYICGNIKLRSYYTKVHQIYKHFCSQIIADELFKNQNAARMAIFQAVLECQGDER